MFGNNKSTEMVKPERRSGRDFAKAKKLDEKELAQALVDVGMYSPTQFKKVIEQVEEQRHSPSSCTI